VISFFTNLSFPRAVILLSFIASGVLGYYVRRDTDRLDQIHRELRDVPGIVQEIQRLGIEVEQYRQLADANSTTKGADFDFTTYIRSIAADPLVGIGQVKVDPSTRSAAKDIIDRVYKIRPNNKNQRYGRQRIGNFLYKLEAESRRVRVTRFIMTPFDKIKPGDIGSDEWSFEAAITSRSQVGAGS